MKDLEKLNESAVTTKENEKNVEWEWKQNKQYEGGSASY
jgi:hypothetical protein